MDKRISDLANEIEASFTLNDDLVARVREVLQDTLSHAAGDCDFDSTDDVLGLVNEFRSGWYLSMRGTALLPNGHWSCTLRQSDVRDNDSYIGIGNGPTLPHALLAALLKAVAQVGGSD